MPGFVPQFPSLQSGLAAALLVSSLIGQRSTGNIITWALPWREGRGKGAGRCAYCVAGTAEKALAPGCSVGLFVFFLNLENRNPGQRKIN